MQIGGTASAPEDGCSGEIRNVPTVTRHGITSRRAWKITQSRTHSRAHIPSTSSLAHLEGPASRDRRLLVTISLCHARIVHNGSTARNGSLF
jgi:hypothetical protein